MKVGTKRKAASKGGSRGSRKVKVVTETEEGAEPTMDKHDEVYTATGSDVGVVNDVISPLRRMERRRHDPQYATHLTVHSQSLTTGLL